MKYGRIPGIDQPVSRMVLGTMIITSDELERSCALLDDAFEHGITTLDTAFVYAGGKSEQAIGEWMKRRGNRAKVVIVSKGCHPNAEGKRVTPEALDADLRESLRRLQCDSVDGYLLHRDDPSVPVGPIVEAFNEHARAGRVRAFGGSNWTHQRLAEANDYARQHRLVPFTISSPNYGLAEQVQDPWGPGCVSISGPANAEARKWYADGKMAVLAYSSLGRGLFSGRVDRGNFAQVADRACATAYCHEVNFRRLDRVRELAARRGLTVPQVALAYVLNSPLNMFALVGAASREECRAGAEATEVALSPSELAWLDLQRDAP